MDWLKSETINQWANDVAYSKFFIGPVSKTRRTINALRNYSSNFPVVTPDGKPVRGLQLARGDRKGGGIIYIDEANFRKASRQIEEDMINIGKNRKIRKYKTFPREQYKLFDKLNELLD